MAFEWDLPDDLDRYIRIHLAYELRYLLVAATTWSAVRVEADREQWPDHLVVMAMESAFVHIRVLCEFLQLEEGWSNRSLHRAPKLTLWVGYRTPMNRKVLHPDPSRSYEPGEKIGGDDLKDRVVDLAQEVLSAWDQVAGQGEMEEVRTAMVEAREGAVADGQRAAARMDVDAIFE